MFEIPPSSLVLYETENVLMFEVDGLLYCNGEVQRTYGGKNSLIMTGFAEHRSKDKLCGWQREFGVQKITELK